MATPSQSGAGTERTRRSGGSSPDSAMTANAACSESSSLTWGCAEPTGSGPSNTEITHSEHSGPRARQSAQSTCNTFMATMLQATTDSCIADGPCASPSPASGNVSAGR